MGPKREFQTQGGDAQGFSAIRVPDSFRLKPGESVRVFSYRALASSWKELSPTDLEKCIQTAMPSPAPEEAFKGSATYSPDSKSIAELASDLEPVRRTVVLTELFEARQWEAGAALAQSIWQMRNAPEMNSITLPANLNSGRESPLISTRALHSNAEASQCDAVRALYIRSLPMDGTVDYPRLAQMLKNSEKRALHELVLALSNHKKDPAWNYRDLSPEQQRKQLESFVQHWIAVFSVA